MKVNDLVNLYGANAVAALPADRITPDANVFFVDSSNPLAQDSINDRTGSRWDAPFATLNYAVSRCTASKGDVILLGPGHVETIEDTGTASGTTTDEATVDKAGINIIGVGNGALRPTFTLEGATDATISVIAANVLIENIKIVSNLADVAAGITASAAGDGLVVKNCILTDGADDEELVIGIQLAAACNGCQILNNEFYTVPAGDCASAIKLVGESSRTIIKGNNIQGDYSVAGIDGSTAAATLISVVENDIVNIDTTAGACVNFHASTTGVHARNIQMGGKSIADAYIGAGIVTANNYTTGAVGASGILAEPAADSD